MTLLFAALLGINRLFVADAEQGGFDGFLLAPVDRTALLVGEGARAARLPGGPRARGGARVRAAAARTLARAGAAGPARRCSLLGDIGVAVIGTLVAALAVRTRARDLLGPLLALPLLVPVVIGAARATAPLLRSRHPDGTAAALAADARAL